MLVDYEWVGRSKARYSGETNAVYLGVSLLAGGLKRHGMRRAIDMLASAMQLIADVGG